MCVIEEFCVIEKLGLCGLEVNRWFQCRRWISLFYFSTHFTFCLYHLYECNALSVKNVERLITVWSKAWDDVFFLFLLCILSQVINPRCSSSMTESCNSRASTPGVDIFSSVFVLQPFPHLWGSKSWGASDTLYKDINFPQSDSQCYC